MGSHTQLREAHERASLAVEAVKELAPSVANSANAVNQLVQVVYMLAARLSATEIRVQRLLEHCGMANETLTPEGAESTEVVG